MRFFILFIALFPSFVYGNDVADALQVLRPGAEWTLSGDNYDGLVWLDHSSEKPTKGEVLDTINQINLEHQKQKEYPSIEEQVHALLNGGQELIDMKLRIGEIEKKYPSLAKKKQ